MKPTLSLIRIPACALAVLATGAVAACSGSTPNGAASGLPENTGGVTMELTGVPSDVRCIEIDTTDAITRQVKTDVAPLFGVSVRVAPMNPGQVWLRGSAYSQPCNTIAYDAGASSLTWVAQWTPVNIVPGELTHAALHFVPMGAAEVEVDWDQCGDAGSFSTCGVDGGTDGGDNDGGLPDGRTFDAAPTFDGSFVGD